MMGIGDSYDPHDAHIVAHRLLTVIALITTSAVLWLLHRNDFFGGIYRFFILFKVDLCCSQAGRILRSI